MDEEVIPHNSKGHKAISDLIPWKIDRLGSRIKENDVTSVTSQVILQETAQIKDEELQLSPKERTLFSPVRETVQEKPPRPTFKKSLQHHF